MKRLYIIGGTMGAGKTTLCGIMRDTLDKSVFLDGDWCWDMHPFVVNEETQRMVISNICFLINGFLRCSAFENVIFCWVMHRQQIIDSILSALELDGVEVINVSLICGEESLRHRLEKDVANGLREPDVIGRSVERLPLYEALDTVKLDVSNISAAEAAKLIIGM